MIDFTDEQLSVLDFVKEGYDVLVDACIGSGKTTVLQEACRVLKLAGKKVLYLTYNRRLLEEARKRIDPNDADVHTYHSFAGTMLNMAGVPATSEREVISKFNQHLKRVYKYDVIVVDEYQDISEELKDMLCKLCVMSNTNYGFCPQFLVVGDKDQKIMDNTEIDVVAYYIERLETPYKKICILGIGEYGNTKDADILLKYLEDSEEDRLP